jgi:hypothetical protein
MFVKEKIFAKRKLVINTNHCKLPVLLSMPMHHLAIE